MLHERGTRFQKLRRRAIEDGTLDSEEFEAASEEERNRRKLVARLEGRRMGQYESDPLWDDVVPIPQNEGEGALAAIAYTDEYAEGNRRPRRVPIFFGEGG